MKTVSERLDGLIQLMIDVSGEFEHLAVSARRMMALNIITVQSNVINKLTELSKQLDTEISNDDARIDFQTIQDGTLLRRTKPLFATAAYAGGNADETAIDKVVALFPLGESPTFTPELAGRVKRSLMDTSLLCPNDIVQALRNGMQHIITLLREIKKKMRYAPKEHFVGYCEAFFSTQLELPFTLAKRDYINWKDEHECNSMQELEDKLMQEVLKLLASGVFSHASTPTIREKMNSKIKIAPEALKTDMILPEDIEVECARMARLVTTKGGMLRLDEAKLGKYLYLHHRELTSEEATALRYFKQMQLLIQEDMVKVKLAAETQNECLAPIDVTDKATATQQHIRNAIFTMTAEGTLQHLYDYTWIMTVMNQTRGMPQFNTPSSFIDYLRKLGVKRLPSEDSINRKQNTFTGTFPEWTFINCDTTEANRRINVGKRFMALFRAG